MQQLKLARKRRRMSKTNYKKRLALLKSGKTRLVIRKTNTKLIAQLVDYKPDGDIVLVTACSSELKKLGWKGASKNITAAYLTGMLAAKRAKEKGVKEAIIDIGLHTPTKGSRVFAVAKGALEGGLKVPISEEIVPNKDRIEGKHLKKGNFSEVVSKIK